LHDKSEETEARADRTERIDPSVRKSKASMQMRSGRAVSNELEEEIVVAATSNDQDVIQARAKDTNRRPSGEWTYEDAEFIETGQQLYRFAQAHKQHLRSVRWGRQTLARFIKQFPPSKEVKYRTIWLASTTIANEVLRRWMEVPNNPFGPTDEEKRAYKPRSRNAINTFVEEGTPADESGSDWSESEVTAAARRAKRARSTRAAGQRRERATVGASALGATERAATELGQTEKQTPAAVAGATIAAVAAVKRAAEEALEKALAAAVTIVTAEEDNERNAESLGLFYTVVCAITPDEVAAKTKDGEGEASLDLAWTPGNGDDQQRSSEERIERHEPEPDRESDYGSCGDGSELEELWREEPRQASEGRAIRRESECTDYGSCGDGSELEELCRSDAV
jgi:hypothetical protein